MSDATDSQDAHAAHSDETYTRAGLTFDYRRCGPSGGEVIVLLHGFPQTADTWTVVAESLAASGYRVLVPNQRGYSVGARPVRRSKYRLAELVEDVLALLDAEQVERVHLVGHDWGGGVAWALAARASHKLASLTVVSMPHPRALASAILTSRQIVQSWYLLLFQLPRFPEWIVLRNHGRLGRRWLELAGMAPSLAQTSIQRFLEDRAALTGALNWYRAIPFDLSYGLSIAAVSVPTLFVWSDHDAAVSRKAAQLTTDWVKGPYEFVVLEGGTHWIPEEHPEDLSRLILSHCERFPTSGRISDTQD